TVTRADGVHSGQVAWPNASSMIDATGLSTPDGMAVLVLLGQGRPELMPHVASLLPLLGAIFRAERAADVALAQAHLDKSAAAESGALAEALDTARRELDRGLRARADFLASASHDLRNPLASIKGVAQILNRRAIRGALDQERLVAGLETINSAVTQMAGLLEQIMDTAHLEMGHTLVLDRQEISLVELARAAAAEYQQTTEQHQLYVEAPHGDVTGLWDDARLRRVVGNLLSNAIKYSPTGGPVIVRITQASGRLGPEAVLEVQDHGLGIPAADSLRVFERFQRGENVIGRIAGTGIGLAASRQIVEQHSGSISASSTEGAGSTFSVRLPLAPPADGRKP
ncbi:MAG TPA: HAMP domain-containing sensor histidine kinase, partial [Chloroflexota bacterium]|nr:HAMP domain-containing sensor histidine kinase [Chloroflexota bacterium]